MLHAGHAICVKDCKLISCMNNYKCWKLKFKKCRYLHLLHWNKDHKCILCEEEKVERKVKWALILKTKQLYSSV